MATLSILGVCLIFGCVAAFVCTVIFWFRNAPNLRAINRALEDDELVVPNGVVSSRGVEYIQRFVMAASQTTTDGGRNAFERYRQPTLKWNDVKFAVAFGAFLILGNLAIAATMPLRPYGTWLAYFCALMGFAYGAVKIAEDLALFDLTPGAIAPPRARKLIGLGLAKAAFLFLAMPAALGSFVAFAYKSNPDLLVFGPLKLFPILVIVAGLLVPPFGRALWACRVSLISAFGGYVLFLFVIQAQDLFADTTFGNQPYWHIAYWTWTFFLAAFIWALPAHYAARDALENAQPQTPFAVATVTWLPRLLGTIPLIAILIGIFGAAIETRRATTLIEGLDRQYVLLSSGAWITLGVLLWYFIIRKELVRRYLAHAGWIQLVSLIVTAVIFAILLAAPIWSTQHVTPRAALIPVLFGSAVLVLGRIAVWADRLHRPLLLFLVAFLAVLTAANSRYHEVRLLKNKNVQPATQMPLTEAVTKWRAANDCPASTDPEIDKANKLRCPPALIIAADGGASRSAYFTATVVGELLDRLQKTPAGNGEPTDCPTPADCAKRAHDAKLDARENPARRIFAMSGVSGGSLGIATIKAALLDSDGSPPCHDDKSSSWKTCLQNLVEGDYLSPAFVGLGFRDNFAPPIWPFNSVKSWGDRAALLEESWEKYYLDQSKLGSAHPTCDEKMPIGLCRPFTQQRSDGTWTPLLLLNGTSVQTGRRIIASEISPIWMKEKGKASTPDEASNPQVRLPQVLHQWAYDLFEIMGAPCVSTGGNNQTCASNAAVAAAPPQNIRLSTAALLSARFPVVSPWGNIHTADRSYGDSVVDGGYFENSGLTTALEVAAGLYELGLAPIVLSISNDPGPGPASHSNAASPSDVASRCSTKPTSPGPADLRLPVGLAGADSFWLRLVGTSYAPAAALLNTRDSHAEEAGLELTEHLQQWDVPPQAATQPCLADQYVPFFPIPVFAKGDGYEMPQLSLSWWLSPVVRKALNNQLSLEQNKRQLQLLVDRLSHAGKPNSRE
jgi:hypothetical protein